MPLAPFPKWGFSGIFAILEYEGKRLQKIQKQLIISFR